MPAPVHAPVRCPAPLSPPWLSACLTAMVFSLLPLAVLHPGLPGAALAATAAAPALAVFTLPGVRPEALSWLWDNADEALLRQGNPDIRAFQWLQPPTRPQDLGYSSGASHHLQVSWSGVPRQVSVSHVDPQWVRPFVSSDNFLGKKPHGFVAQQVSVDGGVSFTVLVQYRATGSGFGDTAVDIRLLPVQAGVDLAAAHGYVTHLRKTLEGLRPLLMPALDERLFNGVFKTRGFYSVSPVDKKLNVTLSVVQEIRGIDSQMLAWWWDHIGNTERYRLWQPIDHVSFEWRVPPAQPDLLYDVGAVQRVKEYIGKSALVLDITGADPHAFAPAAPIVEPMFFNARADLTLLKGVLPPNRLTHQWRPNAAGDGVILTSTFVNTALARVVNPTFFDDLGSHALREFQMLPHFLPRLYRREHLGE